MTSSLLKYRCRLPGVRPGGSAAALSRVKGQTGAQSAARSGAVRLSTGLTTTTWQLLLGLFLLTSLLLPGVTQAATPQFNDEIINYVELIADGQPPTTYSVTVTVKGRSPATIEFLHYASPGTPGAEPPITVGVTEYSTSGDPAGPFAFVPNPREFPSNALININNVALVPTNQYSMGAATFIRLTDLEKNENPTSWETVLVTVTSPDTGDTLLLRIRETGINTGVFVGYLQTRDASLPPSAQPILDVVAMGEAEASYIDPTDATDIALDIALISPSATLFNSLSGEALDGAIVTLLNPDLSDATVYADDAVTPVSNVVTTGDVALGLPTGGYRFPYVPPGDYILAVQPPLGFTAPSAILPVDLPAGFSINADGSYGSVFTIYPGPPAVVDLPVDPIAVEPTPSTVEFLHFAPPSTPGAEPAIDVATTQYSTSGDPIGPFTDLPAPTHFPDGTPVDLSSVELVPTEFYLVNEPLFVRLTDLDQNLSPVVRETVLVTVTSPDTGETLLLRITETASDSGVFVGYLQSLDATTPPEAFPTLAVEPDGEIEASYVDDADPTDTSTDTALTSPFAAVFSSANGTPIDGAIVTLLNADLSDATVYAADGLTPVSNVITTGDIALGLPTGGFRFPYVPPGDYILSVQTPTGYTWASAVPPASLPTGFSIDINGSYGNLFNIAPGPPSVVDIPVDPFVVVRTPSAIEFLHFAPPGTPGAQPAIDLAITEYSSGDASGPFAPLPTPTQFPDGTSVDLTSVELVPTDDYHIGEPVFVRLTDLDQNLNPTLRETVLVTLLCAATGDTILLRITETEVNSGVFVGYIQSRNVSTPPTTFPTLAVEPECRIEAHYTDVSDGTDVSTAAALVDPYGIVFDSQTGEAIDGATVRILFTDDSTPPVFADDGVTPFPNEVVSGDSTLGFPEGGFRFPYVAPGDYKLVVEPPAGYTWISRVAPTDLPEGFSIDPDGSYGQSFTLYPGPPVRIDIPVDPEVTGLWLQKSVNRASVAIGDYVQYRLTLQNISETALAVDVHITDQLPSGFRYQSGSAESDDVKLTPTISGDGRTLVFAIGDLPATETATVTYVTEITAGARLGNAVNTAQAVDTSGTLSNLAEESVEVREDLFRSKALVAGRVIDGPCETPDTDKPGLGDVRILLEDGTMVLTDENGMFHFEGIDPGVHVVQLDHESLPEHYQLLACEENTRFGGRDFSQFVDIQGGTLWRTDFYVAPKPPPTGEVGVELISSMENGQLVYRAELSGTEVPLENLRLVMTLPAGASYISETAQLADGSSKEPTINEQVLTFELGDSDGDWQRTLRFRAELDPEIETSELATVAVLVFDAPQATAQETPEAETRLQVTGGEPILSRKFLVRSHFDSFESTLDDADRDILDNLAEQLDDWDVLHVFVVGHTDSVRIAPRSRHIHADNQALSIARARSVSSYLDRVLDLAPGQISLDGVAETQPVAGNKTAKGRAQNRRVEVLGLAKQGDVTLTQPEPPLAAVIIPEAPAPVVAEQQPEVKQDSRVYRHPMITVPARSRPNQTVPGVPVEEVNTRTEPVPETPLAVQPPVQPVVEPKKTIQTRQAPPAPEVVAAPRPTHRQFALWPNFTGRTAELTVEATAPITRLVQQLKLQNVQRLNVTSHSGYRDLSRQRAQKVADILSSALSLQPDQIKVYAMGQLGPVPEQGPTPNNRVEVEIVSAPSAQSANVRETSPATTTPSNVSSTEQAGSPRQSRTTATITAAEAATLQAFAEEQRQSTEASLEQTEQVGRQQPKIELTKPRSGRQTTATQGLVPGAPVAPPTEEELVEDTREGILSFSEGDLLIHQHNAIRLRVNGKLKTTLMLDGVEVPSDRIGFRMREESGSVLMTYIGVDFGDPGPHTLQLLGKDPFGITRYEQTLSLVRTGEITGLRVVEAAGNIADGKTPVRLRLELRDSNDQVVPVGTELRLIEGTLQPYKKDSLIPEDPTGQVTVDIDKDGTILFQPVNMAGPYEVELAYNDVTLKVETYVKPYLRDWILVGFAEGTVGYRTIDSHMEETPDDLDEHYFSDGQVKFYAKGRVKGDWLMTLAYDSDKPDLDGESLHQTIDPGSYYTVYGDTSQQHYDSASARNLYVRMDKDQFYALFGDFDTGLSTTELSRYSRSLSGIKTSMEHEDFTFTAFASDTRQIFVKDEIQGDGTSGLYRLSNGPIVRNSEKISIEIRGRLHSELIIDSTDLSRHSDYDIDYDAGTLFFKRPIASRDDEFNPVFIVVRYEVEGSDTQHLTYGGRGAVRLFDRRLEVGASHIHEDQGEDQGDLYGVDATYEFTEETRLHAEWATTSVDDNGTKRRGDATLVEFEHEGERLSGRAYFREQQNKFGLGQQNDSENGTRKTGIEAESRLSENFKLRGQVYREDNLATDAQRDVFEADIQYDQDVYSLSLGYREATDRFADGDREESRQLLSGVDVRLFDERLTLRADHEQSLGSKNGNSDYPTRTVLGADLGITAGVTLFAEQEFTHGDSKETESSRVGMRATPWQGGELNTALQQEFNEDGQRVFALMGLLQTWEMNEEWSFDAALDRSQTLKDYTGQRVNENVPAASGSSDDFTAISLGATYRQERWEWWNRIEMRQSDSEDKYGVTSGILSEPWQGTAFSADTQLFITDSTIGSRSTNFDLRLGTAYRPARSRWMLLDRFDFEFDRLDGLNTWRLINNLNANYKPHRRMQVSLQHGIKYVQDSIGDNTYSGVTDLFGLETRYDLSRRWDIGMHGSVLHSWNGGQLDYSLGASLGYLVMKNAWVSLGYNLLGFHDEDFSKANFTAQGPFVRFRFKFDQQSVREAVGWANSQ